MPNAGLDELADDCRRFPRTVVDDVLPVLGAQLVDTATAATAAAGGTLSRYNRGAGVRLDVTARAGRRDTITLVPQPIGAWTIAQAGSRRQTWMEPAGAGPGKLPARRLRLQSGDVRWYVRHGPVRGRQVWSTVLDAVEADLPTVVHNAVAQSWADLRGSG